MHHRYYHPRLGHFLTPDFRAPDIYDPTTFTEPYAYASGNPVMFWDPDGRADVLFSNGRETIILDIEQSIYEDISYGRATEILGVNGERIPIAAILPDAGTYPDAIMNRQSIGLNLIGQAILGSEYRYVDNARFWRNAYNVTAYGSVAVVGGWAYGGRLLTGLGNTGRSLWSMGGNAWAGIQNLGRSAISKLYMNPRWFVFGEEAFRTTAEVATGADLGPSANDFVAPLARTVRSTTGEILETLTSSTARTGTRNAADFVDDGLNVLTDAEVHAWMGTERHHSLFRMFLRAFDKAGYSVRTAGGRMRPQSLVDLPTSLHRDQLHELWDLVHPDLARGQGASDRIAQLIRSGQYSPTEIIDTLQDFYKVTLKENPDELNEVLKALTSIRSRLEL